MLKQISMKGLADYMLARPAKQHSILRDFKYPDDDEPRAKSVYYSEACARIAAFHKQRHTVQWLLDEAERLDQRARSSKPSSRTRLRNNARALQQYAHNFGSKHYDVLGRRRMRIDIGDVRINVAPDLHVRDKDTVKLIKFGFGTKAPNDEVVRIVSQLLFEAASRAMPGINSSSVLFVDVPRGAVRKGARLGARTRADIEAACKTISSVWDSL